jgi:putative component of membrane protein insertase Oxa1/YidC/SpoIIIJ protein YidD
MLKSILLIIVFAMLAGSAWAASLTSAADKADGDTTIATAPIHFFRNILSGADGHRCPMTPSCSRYALTAIQRHGAFMGWIMACDRLMRCGRDELKHSPTVMTRNGVRCRDTVDNNDFWWH